MQERKRLSIAVLPILGEPSAAIEPSKRALDNPAFGQDNKPFGPIRALDDLHVQRGWILEPSATELYENRICTSLPSSLRIA